MPQYIYDLKTFTEKRAFGVCDWLGAKMQIRSARIRMFFIYTSFLTIGSPVIIYLVLAFWLDLRKLIQQKRNSIWDM